MSSQWHPMTDYEVAPADLADKELRALSGVWIERRDMLGESDGDKEFNERLIREWAIETGLIERLYTLDRGITELMIEHGVNAALIPHTPGENPQRTAALIGDQQDAIESVFAFVKGDRRLSTSYVKELHSLFTRNQEYVEGVDQFGRKTRVPLIRGDYKQQPNNPTRPDGEVHHYCPPEHVAAEMDRLIELHIAHDAVPPEVEAAWLHHLFARIHPFQDGNGRVARALATLVFVKAGWLPLVVRDRDRKKYIDALESADGGNLKSLVSFFSGLQREELIRAIGIARDIERAGRVDARIEVIRRRVTQRRDALKQEWQAAVSTASHLHTLAKERLEKISSSLEKAVEGHAEFSFFVDHEENEGDRSYDFHRQIVSTARKLRYFSSTQHYRSWARLVVREKDGNQGNILIAFHCIGHEFQGVLGCSGTWFLRVRTEDGGSETVGETALSDDVFQINYKEDVEDARSRFTDWLERVLERGLALWESAL